MKEIQIVNGKPSKESLQSFSKNCTGDACVGDTVLFKRAVYIGDYGSAVLSHYEQIIATIDKDSYGKAKQQHTFTLHVLWSSDGKSGRMIIKGRNLYKKGTKRQLWENEAERKEILEEKHQRGSAARKTRNVRKAIARSYKK